MFVSRHEGCENPSKHMLGAANESSRSGKCLLSIRHTERRARSQWICHFHGIETQFKRSLGTEASIGRIHLQRKCVMAWSLAGYRLEEQASKFFILRYTNHVHDIMAFQSPSPSSQLAYLKLSQELFSVHGLGNQEHLRQGCNTEGTFKDTSAISSCQGGSSKLGKQMEQHGRCKRRGIAFPNYAYNLIQSLRVSVWWRIGRKLIGYCARRRSLCASVTLPPSHPASASIWVDYITSVDPSRLRWARLSMESSMANTRRMVAASTQTNLWRWPFPRFP